MAHYRPLHGERAQPGAIMVDRRGRRFVNEAQNYGDVGRAMRRAARRTSRRRAPWWMVFDAAYRGRYPVGPLEPAAHRDPGWLVRGDDLDALVAATVIGVGHTGRAPWHVSTPVRRSERTPSSDGARTPTTAGSATRAPLIRPWPRCARPPSTPLRSISGAWGPRAVPHRRPWSRAVGAGNRRGRAVRGRQRRRQPLRHRHRGGRVRRSGPPSSSDGVPVRPRRVDR